MSFEPTYDECLDCPCYIAGDGKKSIARCLADEGTCQPTYCPEFTLIDWPNKITGGHGNEGRI